MDKNIIGLVMTATVAIILVATLLVPIINDVGVERETFSNGTAYVEYSTEDAVITVARDSGTNIEVKYNDTELSVSNVFYLLSESFYVYNPGSSAVIGYSGSTTEITVPASTTYTITITDNSAVINDGTNDVATVDCAGVYYTTTEKTDQVLRLSKSTNTYYNEVSDLFFVQLVSGDWTCLDGGKLYVDGTETDYTVTSGLYAVSGYTDLNAVAYNGPVLDVSGSSVSLTYSYVVPAKVVGTLEDQPASTALYAIIPVLILLVVLIGFITAAVAKKE